MQDEFDLATVLSITTGVNLTDNFEKVLDLFCFMFEDELLSPLAMVNLRTTACNHLFRIHPEIKNLKYDKTVGVDEWVQRQKVIYGDTLTISVVGEDIVVFKRQPFASEK